MDQGWSVHRIRVRADGTLASPPTLLRESGFADLDAAALEAIVEAAPFPPLPDGLSREGSVHPLRMTIEHANPMVR
jgi:TonB family protein